MKKICAILIMAFVAALSGIARGNDAAIQKRTEQSIAGMWKGKFDNTPAVDISLRVSGGKLAGTCVFYRVENGDAGAEVKPTAELPMVDPSFDGAVLTFKVKRPDGSSFAARIKFIAENEAVLRPADQPNDSDEHAMSLVREK